MKGPGFWPGLFYLFHHDGKMDLKIIINHPVAKVLEKLARTVSDVVESSVNNHGACECFLFSTSFYFCCESVGVGGSFNL